MSYRTFTIQAEATSLDDSTGSALPDSICWMPPGQHTIYPRIKDGDKQVDSDGITMNVTPELAERFNEQLQEIRKQAVAGQGDYPYIDFNHNDDGAAAEVMELYWGGDDPKTGGIRARVKWSDRGKASVLGKEFRRFSPQWELDPDTMQPDHITPNLGGLVNRAAFQSISPLVSARQAQAVRVQGIVSDTERILAQAEANSDRKGIPLVQAISDLMRKPGNITAYARYRNAILSGEAQKAFGVGRVSGPSSPRNYEPTKQAVELGDAYTEAARKLASERGISVEQAFVAIATENPDFATEYRRIVIKNQ